MSLDNGYTNVVENDEIDEHLINVNETKTTEAEDDSDDTLLAFILKDDRLNETVQINNENISFKAKEIENLENTLSNDNLILDEVDEANVHQNESKYANENFLNLIILQQAVGKIILTFMMIGIDSNFKNLRYDFIR